MIAILVVYIHIIFQLFVSNIDQIPSDNLGNYINEKT